MARNATKFPLPEQLWNVSLLPAPRRRSVGSIVPPEGGAGALKVPAVLSLREGEAAAPLARAA